MTADTDQTEHSQESFPIAPAHFVYLVQCANGAIYCGYTTDVEKRIATHNAGKGAKYTRAHLPVTLMVSWSYPSKSDALRAERAIKQLSHVQKCVSLSRLYEAYLALLLFERERRVRPMVET